MSLYEELVKTAKESDTNVYSGVKIEVLKLVEEIKVKTKEDANVGLFSSVVYAMSKDYPNISYIYRDLNCLNSLGCVLSRLLDSSLSLSVTETEKHNLKISIHWYNSLHVLLCEDLTNGK